MKIQDLNSLIHQFNAHEQTLIRYALKNSKDDDDENKSLRLFEYVIGQKKNLSSGAASLAIYHAPTDTRINKLIGRLWEKILEIITSENFLRKNEKLNEQALLRIGVRKKLLQYVTIGFLDGNFESMKKLLETGIRDARKSEHTLALLELYRYKRSFVMFRDNVKEYDVCNRQLTFYEKCYSTEQKLLHHYNEIIKEDGYGNSMSPQKKLKYLEELLNSLGREKKFIISVQSKKLFGLIQLECFYLKENYSGAKKMLERLLKNIGSSFMAGGKADVATRIEAELSNCELLLGNYSRSIKYREKSLSGLWTTNKLNYFVVLDKLFYPVFYTEDFNRAEKIIAEFLSDQNPIRNDFRITKYKYFEACVHFKKRGYKQALEIVNKPLPLNKDKTGYDIAVRILRIQCLFALERFDEASAHIENLRKHISRNHKKTYTSERNKLIARVLVLMQKRGFSGKQNKTEIELLKKLSLSSGKYKWAPLTPELIRFHEWHKETVK